MQRERLRRGQGAPHRARASHPSRWAVPPRACAGVVCAGSGTEISGQLCDGAPRACATSPALDRCARIEACDHGPADRRTRLRSNKWLLQSGARVHPCEARDQPTHSVERIPRAAYARSRTTALARGGRANALGMRDQTLGALGHPSSRRRVPRPTGPSSRGWSDRRAGRAGQHGSRVNRLVDRRTVRRSDRRALRSEDDRHPSRSAGALLHPRANETLLPTRAAMVAAAAPLQFM